MTPPQIVFFGSFQHYSSLILEQLMASPLLNVLGVVTTPPAMIKQQLKPNPTHQLAEKLKLSVVTPEVLNAGTLADLKSRFPEVEYFLTAGYGKLLPPEWLSAPGIAALNLHFSLLPKYRGANPAEWALLRGETETGVTLIEMSPEFDTGRMVAQAGLEIESNATRETLYQDLYELGGQVIPQMLDTYHRFKTNQPLEPVTPGIDISLPPLDQPPSPTPYARRLVREDGFIDWNLVHQAMSSAKSRSQGLSPTLQEIYSSLDQVSIPLFIERAVRALAGFPGVWTMVKTAKGEKRLKIQHASITPKNTLLLETVQLEGKASSKWNEIKNSVIS